MMAEYTLSLKVQVESATLPEHLISTPISLVIRTSKSSLAPPSFVKQAFTVPWQLVPLFSKHQHHLIDSCQFLHVQCQYTLHLLALTSHTSPKSLQWIGSFSMLGALDKLWPASSHAEYISSMHPLPLLSPAV